MQQGWIKLYRSLLDSAVFASQKTLQVWIWCLLKASHKETKFLWNDAEETLAPGQFISGRIRGASDCKMNESTFWKHVKTLEKLKQITLKSNNRFTLFTVVNWAEYQLDDEIVTAKEQQSDSQVTTEEQQSNTFKNVKNGKNGRKDIVPEKLRYGENVLLTQDEYDKLVVYFNSEELLKSAIENLDDYFSLNDKYRKKHSDHAYNVIRAWDRKDKREGKGRYAPTRTNTTARQSEQIARATFKHGPEDVERLRNLQASLELISGERH